MVFERALLFVLRVLYFLDKNSKEKNFSGNIWSSFNFIYFNLVYQEILIFLIRVNDHSFQFAKIRIHPWHQRFLQPEHTPCDIELEVYNYASLFKPTDADLTLQSHLTGAAQLS